MQRNIYVTIPPEYEPLVEQIDEFCEESGFSRSSFFRNLLCEVFDFTPTEQCRDRDSRGRIKYLRACLKIQLYLTIGIGLINLRRESVALNL
jgi:hypothetical protein